MATIAVPIGDNQVGKGTNARGMKIGIAVAGAIAGAYGIRWAFSRRSSGFRQYKNRLEEWLNIRMVSLSESLGATAEIAGRISDEVRSASKTMLCLTEKARKAKPEKRDMIEIVVDRRFLKMKAKIHKLLDLTEAAQAEALHGFYEELRGWLIPAPAERAPAEQ